MKKILFLTNIPSPYRVNFFNALGKLCDLTVVFERGSSSERDTSWLKYDTTYFTPIMLHGMKRGVDKAFCPDVVKHLKKNTYDHIIVSNFLTPAGMLAILWLRLRKMDYWLESDGGFAKNGLGFKEKFKRFFIRGAHGYFSTAAEHDRYYQQYGAAENRIYRYPFTSLYAKDILEAPVASETKVALREKLGMTEKRVIVAVGQFIRRKGFDLLLDAMAKLPDDIGCYIIGGIPTEEYLQQAERLQLKTVHFVGFQSKENLAEYFAAADLMVHPTREDIWGLVVGEAMAKGLPVVTTNRCIAGLELVTDPSYGAIVPTNDADALAQAIVCTLRETNDDARRQILEKIKGYTFEKMVQQHIEILQK